MITPITFDRFLQIRGACRAKGAPRPASERGFTLLELLIAMVIAGMVVGAVSFHIVQGNAHAIRTEAQRIALLLQLGRDEAILRDHPVAFEADSERYRFLVHENNRWLPLSDDAMLHARAFRQTPVRLSVEPPLISDSANPLMLHIVFGREPVDKPFLMTLSVGDASAAISATIHADGIGHFFVEQAE